jgi:hypothetical protein
MPTQYPPDPQVPYMQENGPSDPDFVVKDGKGMVVSLIYIRSNLQVDEMIDKSVIKNILVYIQDTKPTTLKHLLDFENTLFVPLGPDESMPGLGAPNPLIYQ